ncbi:MAG: NADH-quinone oxidoreductase subunit N [Bacteroidota bacterium]
MGSSLKLELSIIQESLSQFYPELILSGAIILLVLVDLILKRKGQTVYVAMALASLSLVFVSLVTQWNQDPQVSLFLGMISLDRFAIIFKVLFAAGTLLTVFASWSYWNKGQIREKHAEYYTLILALALGSFLLAMASNLLMIYLSVEVLSISAYVLTNFSFNRKTSESAMKYVLFGGLSSGIMIYGISLLYGFTGTLDITSGQMVAGLLDQSSTGEPNVLLIIAIIMVLGGFLFKISSAPFHIWTPDVYETAPTPVVAFFSIVPKLAGFAVLLKFVLVIHLYGQSPLDWQVMLTVISIATLTIGNFSALFQKNAKRMLAYSSIAHSGFILVGVVAFSKFGMQTILFYGGIYLLMNFAAFLIVQMIERRTGAVMIEEYKGLGRQLPFLGALMLIVMIALTGLPPTAGFTAKLLIFSALWDTYDQIGDNYLFAFLIIGLLNTVVSLFYYLKIPYFMFFKPQKAENDVSELKSAKENYLIAILVIMILLFFFKPDWLMGYLQNVNFGV